MAELTALKISADMTKIRTQFIDSSLESRKHAGTIQWSFSIGDAV